MKFISLEFLLNLLQKEEKIRVLRQRLVERGDKPDAVTTTGTVAGASNANGNGSGGSTNNNNAPTNATSNSKSVSISQGKEPIIIIQPESTTASDFDSAIGGGLSNYTRSSQSQSDVDLSESYC